MEKTKFETKSQFRILAKDKLARVSNIYKRDKVICAQILNQLKSLKINAILLYIPLPVEVNIGNIISFCRKKYRVYVPFMEGVSFKLVKYRLPLHNKRFNIKEPKNSFGVVSKIDLAIVPVVGVDGAFKRIGFGKGMYDRFFESLAPKPTILFVQREMCFTKTILSQEHDIEADIYLTPYKTTIKRGKNGFRVTSSRCRSNYKRYRGICGCQKNGNCKL